MTQLCMQNKLHFLKMTRVEIKKVTRDKRAGIQAHLSLAWGDF